MRILRLPGFVGQNRDVPVANMRSVAARLLISILGTVAGTDVYAQLTAPNTPEVSVSVTAGSSHGAAAFLAELVGILRTLEDKGVLSKGAAAEIKRSFEDVGKRYPAVLVQLRELGAIPEIVSSPAPADELTPVALRGTAPRGIVELFGTRTVSESEIKETIRRIYLPARTDGAPYDMYVREAYAAYIANGRFRGADGSLNKEAIADYSLGERATHALFESGLERMASNGTLRAYVKTLNHFIAHADSAGVKMKPEQFRRGLARLTGCFEATSGLNPETYVESCSTLIRWLGDGDKDRTISVKVHDPGRADRAVVRTLAPWDKAYASKAYGNPFSEVQERANDRFWKDYFQRYLDKGEAIEAGIAAKEMRAVADLTHTLAQSMRAISAYASSSKIGGRVPTLADIRRMTTEARRMKDTLEAQGSPSIKGSAEYRQTMQGFEQVIERARKIGAE